MKIPIYCLVLLVLSAGIGSGQATGRLVGSVTDGESGEGLPGVNLILEDTGWGTSTDLEGRFELQGIAPGTYVLRASIIGYEAYKRKVKVRAGRETRFDFHLHPSPIHLGEVLVQSERAYSAASSRSVRAFDLEIRPSRTAHQMLQMAPGLVIAQHAGGGKAEQIFLRGFDADHGTDVAIESAAITLMGGSLHGVADAMAISAATVRNIKQNLFGAFIYNSLGVPVAAGVLYPITGSLLSPVIAGAAMSLSSVTVVSNANRLRLFKTRRGTS